MRDMKKHSFTKRKRKAKLVDHERLQRDAEVTRRYGWTAHRSCGTKIAYQSEDEAMSSAARYSRRTVGLLRAYECPYCGKWHLTSH